MVVSRRRHHRHGRQVAIARPSLNSRKISASLIVDRPLTDVWKIITDYDSLAEHVPNLVQVSDELLVGRLSVGLRVVGQTK